MKPKRIAVCFLLSAVLHILLVVLVFSVILQADDYPTVDTPQPQMTIQVMPMQPPPPPPPAPPPLRKQETKPFIDSAGLAKTERNVEDALFESDASTVAQSKTSGQGNPTLPNQTGDTSFFNLTESAYTPDTKSKPAPPVVAKPVPPASQPSPLEPEPDREPQPEKQTAGQFREQDTPREKLLRAGEELTVAKLQETVPQKAPPLPSPAPETPMVQSNDPARAPPSSFSADRRLSEIQGGASVGDVSSVASQQTELGRYKAKLYRAIGSRWYLYVQQRISLLSVGTVTIRFYVRANGVIEQPTFVAGEARTPLGIISRRAIMEVGALEPFPEALRQQLGEGFYEEITFNIY